MKSGDKVRASMWYGSLRADRCESLTLSPFTKKINLMLKKVLSSAKVAASLIPPCEMVPPGLLLLVLPCVCSYGLGSPTSHPNGTAGRAANHSGAWG